MTGVSDLRINLLVGDGVTHCINVPEVVKKESKEHFPLGNQPNCQVFKFDSLGLGHAEQLLFSCLWSNLAVYR